jgi:para-nitrobenzyl esterase
LIFLTFAACGDDGEGEALPTATSTPIPTSTRTASPTHTATRTATSTGAAPTATVTLTPAVDSLLVTTDQGSLRGFLRDGARNFVGIPYAAPPVGELRWKPPAAPPSWTETRLATAAGNVCPQVIPVINFPTGDEDCLFVNVHAPDPPPQQPAPVMVWIHGGAFNSGDGLQYGNGTDGAVMARDAGVVVVSMNYRLGQLGFLADRALSTEDPERNVSGNYGLLDQIAALEWVQRNIAAFGGDPGNVTIFGESAGGWSVCAHLASPLSAGLFHRAIVQSGICGQPLASLAAAETQGNRFALELGCDGAADVLACIRAKTAMEVIAALPGDPNFAFSEGEFGSWFPTLDGQVFSEQMADSFTAGTFNQVPTMVGSTRDEGTLFVMLSHDSVGRPLTPEDYPERVMSLLGDEELVDAVLAEYPLEAFAGPFESLSAVFGDGFLACPTIDTGRLVSAHVPTYLYQFEYPDADFALPPSAPLGAFHSAEIQFVFGRPTSPPFTEEEMELSEQLIGYWTRFATTGDPNGEGATSWPLLDATQPHLILDRTITEGRDAKGEACNFWRGLDYFRPPIPEPET